MKLSIALVLLISVCSSISLAKKIEEVGKGSWINVYFSTVPRVSQGSNRPRAFRSYRYFVGSDLISPGETASMLELEIAYCNRFSVDKQIAQIFKNLLSAKEKSKTVGCNLEFVKNLGEMLDEYEEFPHLKSYLSFYGGKSIAFCLFGPRQLSSKEASSIGANMGSYIGAMKSYYKSADANGGRLTILRKLEDKNRRINCTHANFSSFYHLLKEAADFPNIVNYTKSRLYRIAKYCSSIYEQDELKASESRRILAELSQSKNDILPYLIK